MKKVKFYLVRVLLILFLIWVVFSFFDIIGNNQPWQEHNYWKFNFFELMIKLFRG